MMNRMLLVLAAVGCGEPRSDTHAIPLDDYAIRDLAIDDDERVVVLAETIAGSGPSAVLRMDPFGTPDPTFGTDGVVFLDDIPRTRKLAIVDGAIRIALPIELQDDQSLVILGLDASGARDGFEVRLGEVPGREEIQEMFAHDGLLVVNASPFPDDTGELARYRPDGSRDPAFAATAGMRHVPVDDGKLLRLSRVNGGSRGVLLERLGPEGTLDATFVTRELAGVDVRASTFDVHRSPGGAVVLGGGVDAIHAVRLTAGGAVDDRFDARHSIPRLAIGRVFAMPDGAAMLFGSTDTFAGVLRLRPDGSLDEAFGPGGLRLFPDATGWTATAARSDGAVVASTIHFLVDPAGVESRLTVVE